MKKLLLKAIPWFITLGAVYLIINSLDWHTLKGHIVDAHVFPLLLATLLTSFSYLFRSRRWQFLFPTKLLTFWNSFRVLILGFFMNNILPARTGEIVRAHMGAKLTGEKRTLVLATIANERLADGVMLSLMLLPFLFSIGNDEVSNGLMWVVVLFALAAVAFGAVLLLREQLFSLFDTFHGKLQWKSTDYTRNRIRLFLHGLSPLFSLKRFPIVLLWSVLVWLVELTVYIAVATSYDVELSLAQAIIFLAAVNFSSLIPAAPGGIGVIEAIASHILVAVGVTQDFEIALAMVLSQHVIQYIVVGAPGAFVMFSWRSKLEEIEEDTQLEHE